MGKDLEDHQPKLPEAKVRVHCGCFKAIVNSVQGAGRQRFALFLGKWWKGKGAQATWRANCTIASASLDMLSSAAATKLAEIEGSKVLGVAVVDYVEERARASGDKKPPETVCQWLQKFDENLVEQHIIMQADIHPQSSKHHLWVFDRQGDSQFQRVSMPFLSKRLKEENLEFIDADAKKTTSLTEMVNEVVSET